MKTQSSKVFLFITLIFLSLSSFSQTKDTKQPDIRNLVEKNGIVVVNREMSVIQDGSRVGIRLNEKDGDGIAWLKDVSFSNGTLEFDVKGRDVQGKSFVGIAFHGTDNTTYDAIYLRPFNFKSEDKNRRSHSVQYIAQPVYTWNKLREEFPNKYEQAIEPAPDPISWVHVKVMVNGQKITVYINNGTQSSLSVEKLSKQTKGSVGFWVGNGSDGEFSNLKITSN